MLLALGIQFDQGMDIPLSLSFRSFDNSASTVNRKDVVPIDE